MNNCTAHSKIKNFTNINLIFLLVHTTFVLQPIDQGVIRTLEAHCRRRIVRLRTKPLGDNKPRPKIIILQAMNNLVSSWNAVSEKTIANCFKKDNISHANQQTVTDADDPSKTLEKEAYNIQKLNQSVIQDNLSAESFIGLGS